MDTDDQMIRVLLAEPSASAHSVAVARRRLMDEIGGKPAVGHRARWPVRMWRWSLAGGGLAGVAAVGLALAMAAGPTGTGGVDPDAGRNGDGGPGVAAPPGPAADASPEQLLLAAATRAADTEGTGKFWRVLTVIESGPLVVRAGSEPYNLMQREATETWTAREPGGRSWTGYQALGAHPRADADRAAWERAGSPRNFDLGPADSASGGRSTRSTDPSPGRLDLNESYPVYDSVFGPLALADLPTEAQALRTAVLALIDRQREGGGGTQADTDWSMFSLLSGLLTDTPASPALRSAAFTVLSNIPGVINAGPAQDATGRPGVALELRQVNGKHASHARLILDPTTYRLLGATGVSGDAGPDGQVDTTRGNVFKEKSTVVLKAEWTDQEPVAPSML